MNATRRLLSSTSRQPMIKFLGRRNTPSNIDHTPHTHPASPTDSLPSSFAAYRQKAQQHGPLLSGARSASTVVPGGHIGSHTGASLGPVEPPRGSGLLFDRSELPERFRRTAVWTETEIEAVESGGASLF